MPVEESGNMLMLIMYTAKLQKNIKYLDGYWDILEQWGNYLVGSLPDPGN